MKIFFDISLALCRQYCIIESLSGRGRRKSLFSVTLKYYSYQQNFSFLPSKSLFFFSWLIFSIYFYTPHLFFITYFILFISMLSFLLSSSNSPCFPTYPHNYLYRFNFLFYTNYTHIRIFMHAFMWREWFLYFSCRYLHYKVNVSIRYVNVCYIRKLMRNFQWKLSKFCFDVYLNFN